ncbi:NAD(P)-binding protein, partial [Fragilariopsis cylindrus CCMP1102]
AIITGASKGIGRAIVISLARRCSGNDIDGIILVARNKEKLDLLSNEITNCYYGIQTLVVQCDITSDHDISDMIKMIKSKNINITILIANAGVGDRADFINMTQPKMELILNTNIIGTTKLIHQVATQLMIQKQESNKRKRKRMIVLMSSIAGSVPGVPSSAVYAASKAYQRSFCSSLSRELESLDEEDDDDDDGSAVQVQCIMPGAV